ncbi:hypothetical protein GGR57DRAFT_495649 [Xylariaceae sp. FL1272]|nr:hypothetical protein GGR57DRAFT_495649 [Xylariaceae sp. FL1272]
MKQRESRVFDARHYKFCHPLEHVYALPTPSPRKRTRPMEVICIGLPRCGTESLQHALLTLGYDATNHGWDIALEDPNYYQQWVKLSRKKWFGPLNGNNDITAADFHALIGNAVAVTDTAASVFAAEIIAAYPDAKVILNQRKDIDELHHSISNTIARADSHWPLFILSCLGRECFWAWQSHVRFFCPCLFRALDGDIKLHYNMVHRLVPVDHRLEWTVEDGWEALCKFLNKPIPDRPFPHQNTAAG